MNILVIVCEKGICINRLNSLHSVLAIMSISPLQVL